MTDTPTPGIRERIQEGAALTREQAVELARFEAAHLGLTLPEAIDRHRASSLPIDAVGTDLGYLIDMLGLNTQEEHPS